MIHPHPHARAAREAMAAAAAGDIGPIDALVCDDIEMINHDNGAAPWPRLEGKEAFFGFYATWLEMFGGTFFQELVDVLAGDDHVVLLVHETGTKDGVDFDNRAVYLVELRDGRWARLETFDRDRASCDRFWAAVGMPEPSPM